MLDPKPHSSPAEPLSPWAQGERTAFKLTWLLSWNCKWAYGLRATCSFLFLRGRCRQSRRMGIYPPC